MPRSALACLAILFALGASPAHAQTPFPPTPAPPPEASTGGVWGPAPERGDVVVRLQRARRVARAGSVLLPAGAALYIGGLVAAEGVLVSSTGDEDEVAIAVAGLGAATLWAGSITWGAGELMTARRLRDLGADVREGAGLAAVMCGALNVWLCTAIAAPIQHRNNAEAGRATPAPPGTPFSVSLLPGRRPILLARFTF
jgi:hypothetical protein